MIEAIGYVRVSSEEQADSGLGLEAQRQRIAASAATDDADELRDVLNPPEPGKTVSQGTIHDAPLARLDANARRRSKSRADIGAGGKRPSGTVLVGRIIRRNPRGVHWRHQQRS
jgi:hypothetical protein